jgi:serine/threonine protein kinase/Tol biopolymer transport system component
MVGKTLRHYRIEATLGAGGMGVVYRALDTHLDRAVAVKVLPSSALSNPDRVRRFVQEAKTASSLNHPSIVTVFDIDSDELDGQPVHFIAMELVIGQTLENIIGHKGLRLKEALKYASQMADGLAAAHSAGIIHRDLKPSNVMITAQGQLKILDFGLAKLSEPTEPDAFAQTRTQPGGAGLITEEGTIVGTTAYMSPEQAEGEPLDARSDVFSFGSVLYEMITGRRAFAGDSRLSTLAAILNRDPPPPHTTAADTPPDLEKIIGRCLRKEPRRRWQTMADLKIALDDCLEEIDSGTGVAPPAHAKSTRRWWFAGIAGVVLGLITGAYVVSRSSRPEPPSFERLTFRHGDISTAKFAPGGLVIYAAVWDGAPPALYSTQPGNREALALGLPSANILSIAPSGEMAILMGNSPAGTEGTLARVPLGGAGPREILENVSAADWSPDGQSLAVVRTVDGRHRLEYPPGKVLFETGRGVAPPPWMRVSPKGDLVALFDIDRTAGDYSLNVVGPNSPLRVLSRGWRGVGGLSWAPEGREIWFAAGHTGNDAAVYAVSLTGRERVVTRTAGWLILDDVARDGRALISTVNSRVGIRCLAPRATEERDLGWLDVSVIREMSPDGKVILSNELEDSEGRNPAIYLRRTDGSPAVKLGYGNRPRLSPDGKWVLCVRREPDGSKVVLLPTGAGEPRSIEGGNLRYDSAEWFPDGKRILFTADESGHPARTYVRDLQGGGPTPITAEGVSASTLSPDGRQVLIRKEGKLLVRSVEGGEPQPLASLEPDESVIRWSGDGRYLFLQRTEPSRRRILRLDVSSGRKDLFRELKPPEPGAYFFNPMVLSADGKSYAFSYQRDLSTLYLATGLK